MTAPIHQPRVDPYGGRLVGLDAWRALLMLGGLLMHATCGQVRTPFFEGVVLVSASFRMGAFFMISGYLNGMALSRRAPGAWLGRRMVQIGVPTAFGLTVICPLITLILFGQSPLHFEWHHLWFLVALTFYSGLACAACRLGDGRFSLDRLCDRYGGGIRVQLLMLLGTATASMILMAAAIRLALAFVPPDHFPLMWQARLILGYAPVYLLGLGLAHSPRLREALFESPTLPAAIVGGVGLVYAVWFGSLGATLPAATATWIGDLIELIGACLCPPAASLLIMKSAQAIRRLPPFVATLRDASFTTYIVHYPLLIAMNLGFACVAWNPYLEYAIAVPVAGLLCLWFHRRVVRRSPILLLLLNGETPDRLPPPRLAHVVVRPSTAKPKPKPRFR